jgi:hypothetical protein
MSNQSDARAWINAVRKLLKTELSQPRNWNPEPLLPEIADAPGAPSAQPEILRMTVAEYDRALDRVFPSYELDDLARFIDDIGQEAGSKGRRGSEVPGRVCERRYAYRRSPVPWLQRTSSGLPTGLPTPDAAVGNRGRPIDNRPQVANLPYNARRIAVCEKTKWHWTGNRSFPSGWVGNAEEAIRSGKGGSRADLLFQRSGAAADFDWKTSGRSALSDRSVTQLDRHAAQMAKPVAEGGLGLTPARVESRSWQDYVPTALRDWQNRNH